MNGTDKIIAHIKAESDAECAAILDEASAKCEEIRAQYDKTAKTEYERILTRGRQDAEIRMSRLAHAAELEAKKQLLAAKQEMVSLVFDRAVRLISEMPENEYVALLARLAAASSRTGSEQIILSAGDRARVGDAVCAKANQALASSGRPAALRLSTETRGIRGGLILSSGDVEVNCSADTLVSQYRNQLSSQIAGILFD